MFWTRGLEEPEDHSWALPFGDLMSLLLAVFVMIAAMSELRAGGKFDAVRDAVRGAFGFQQQAAGPGEGADPRVSEPRDLMGALEAAGLAGEAADVRLLGGADELLALCRVEPVGDRLVLTLAGEEVLDAAGATLTSRGRQAVHRLGGLLADGANSLEVCGRVPAGAAAAGAAADPADLGYRLARLAAGELMAAGVAGSRIRVSSWIGGEGEGGRNANRGGRLEIVVHAERAAAAW